MKDPRMLEDRVASATAVKHTHFATSDVFFFLQAPFPSCLGKAALHVDWGRGNPFAAVIGQ